MATGNGVELQQRNTSTPYEPAKGGLSELLTQMGGVFGENMQRLNNYRPNTAGLGITTPKDYAALRSQVGGAYQPLIDQAGQRTASETNLAGIAAGNQIGNNPYTNQMIQQQADEAMRRATSGIGAMGRGGSGLAQRNLADTYSRSTIPYYQQQYEADQNRMMGANAQIDSSWLNRQNLSRGLQGDRFGMEAGLLGGQTAAEGAQIAGAQSIYDLETADPRWDSAKNYLSILNGAVPYGTQETFEPPPSVLQMIMGVLGSVGGLAGSFLGGDQPGGGMPAQGAIGGAQPVGQQGGWRPRTGILAGY